MSPTGIEDHQPIDNQRYRATKREQTLPILEPRRSTKGLPVLLVCLDQSVELAAERKLADLRGDPRICLKRRVV